MPNQININDVAGDLTKLNAELVKTTNELKDMLVLSEKINTELASSKGFREFNKLLTESQKEQIQTQKLQKQAALDNEQILRAKIKTQQIATPSKVSNLSYGIDSFSLANSLVLKSLSKTLKETALPFKSYLSFSLLVVKSIKPE